MRGRLTGSTDLIDVDLDVCPAFSWLRLALEQPQRCSLLVLSKCSYQVARLQSHQEALSKNFKALSPKP